MELQNSKKGIYIFISSIRFKILQKCHKLETYTII